MCVRIKQQLHLNGEILCSSALTGKSTLVSNLAKSLGAYELNCPPPIMAEIRPLFDDKYPQLVRRTYYALGNYIMGLKVAEMRKEKPVVMDR